MLILDKLKCDYVSGSLYLVQMEVNTYGTNVTPPTNNYNAQNKVYTIEIPPDASNNEKYLVNTGMDFGSFGDGEMVKIALKYINPPGASGTYTNADAGICIRDTVYPPPYREGALSAHYFDKKDTVKAPALATPNNYAVSMDLLIKSFALKLTPRNTTEIAITLSHATSPSKNYIYTDHKIVYDVVNGINTLVLGVAATTNPAADIVFPPKTHFLNGTNSSSPLSVVLVEGPNVQSIDWSTVNTKKALLFF